MGDNFWTTWIKPVGIDDDEIDNPLMDHTLIFRLNYNVQLGPIVEEHRFALASRLQHLWDVIDVGRWNALRLYEKKMISRQDINDIMCHLAVHDIGHFPYSHGPEKVVEDVTGENHKQRGLRLLESSLQHKGRTIRECIESLGADFERVKRLFTGESFGSNLLS
jgi:HD superfamily phosphohydrolase